MEQDFPEKLKQAVNKENYAQFLKLKPLEVKPGYARVELEVKQEHLNIHRITHGGVVFSVLDEAFELASNSHGTSAVALSVSINFLRPTQEGEKIIAEAKEIAITRRTGNYQFLVYNQNGELIAQGQGLVYRKDQPLELKET